MLKKFISMTTAVLLLGTSFSMHGQTVASADTAITDLEIIGLTAPVTGEVPVTTFSTTEYSATVTWSPTIINSIFAGGEFYSATVTLTPATGKTALDSSQSGCLAFTLGTAVSLSCFPATLGEVTLYVDFPTTVASQSDSAISDTAVSGLTAPIAGATAVSALPLSANSQYTATVTWSGGNPTTFAGGMTYTAMVVLIPEAGFAALNSAGDYCPLVFTVPGSSSVICVPQTVSGVQRAQLNVTFPATDSASSSNANLSSFSAQDMVSGDPVVISPTFSAGTTSYSASTSTTSISWGFAFSDSTATIAFYCNGTLLNYAATSCALNSGANNFAARVTAEDSTTIKSYTITITNTPAPTLTEEEIAAAADAAAQAAQAAQAVQASQAAEAAAVARAAQVATAQSFLGSLFRADEGGSIEEFNSASITISSATSLARINAEVLKLSVADRADFTKISEIAEKIEFDESFFNVTSRPELSTYVKYKVAGVTQRTLSIVNIKILELSTELRLNVKAIQEIVEVESFVDRVANPQTRYSVRAIDLVSRNLLAADYARKQTVIRGLDSYDEGSLNSMAKIEAAVEEQKQKAAARDERYKALIAKIAARNK
jgi:hypothetical protein